MSLQNIWNKLIDLGFSENAAAALMGNWDAESGNEACRLQGDFDSSRTISKNYAVTVNNGGGNFIYDSQGWGLAQWTYWSRKKALREYCKTRGVGIEDEDTQVEFAYKELSTEYTTVFKMLLSTSGLYQLVESVCKDYERPAHNNYSVRYQSACNILAKFKGTYTAQTTITTTTTAQTVETTTASTLATFDTKCYPAMPVLKQGDKGIPIGMVQYALVKQGFSLTADCDFGALTVNALKIFQAKNSLTVSGTVDKATWEVLYK